MFLVSQLYCLCRLLVASTSNAMISRFKFANHWLTEHVVVYEDMMNYAVNIHQGGNLLEIVTNAGKPEQSNRTWTMYVDINTHSHSNRSLIFKILP